MPSLTTEITEIATGLAMLGYQSIERAFEVRPRHIANVDDAVFDRLEQALHTGKHRDLFTIAWGNGLAFARSELGLRGRPPWVLEWKGHHRPASKSIETIPADLRIDHVYLISCKYRSKILHNSGPAQLFEHCLAPKGPSIRVDWYDEVACEAYGALWRPVFVETGLAEKNPASVTKPERARIRCYLSEHPLTTADPTYQTFVDEVSKGTALRWRASLDSKPARLEMLWRLLRMQAAPYFVLGSSMTNEPLRYRVNTPWDFQRDFKLLSFDVMPGNRGQPSVDWTALIAERDGTERSVQGHVEVRWSHGKLQGVPEAKVYLDTPALEVAGYTPLADLSDLRPPVCSTPEPAPSLFD